MKKISKHLKTIDAATRGQSKAAPESISNAVIEIQRAIKDGLEISDEDLMSLSPHARKLAIGAFTSLVHQQLFG